MPKSTTRELNGISDPRYVKALAHPLRIRILAMLDERDASPVQLAQHLDASLGTIAYHVRTLEQLGLIKLVATHQRRGATEHVYRALPRQVITDHAWACAPPVAKQALVGATLQQAGDYATRSAAAGGFDRSEAVAARAKQWLTELEQIQADSDTRVSECDGEATDVGLVLLLFEAQPFLPPQEERSGRATAPARATLGA